LATRAKEDAMTVAARVFVKWLRASPTAVEYAHGRGWTDETIRLAGLGYSGKGSPNEGKDLAGELDLHQVDKNNPAREAVMRIPHRMLIYPHVRGGRVKYISCRSIADKKHYNLPSDLVGPRQVYFNHVYGGREKWCVIVEGQADAISLAQWGIPAVALAGTTFRDHNAILEELKKNHEHIYLALDADKAGQNALIGKDGDWPMIKALGAMTRVVNWVAIADIKTDLVKELKENDIGDEKELEISDDIHKEIEIEEEVDIAQVPTGEVNELSEDELREIAQ
jgi:DNA primase